ncbi:hypothetical protein I302_107597 [Kwoniella bestiolae CBS 10118]|uniref:Rho-GAP domain-containing protein n=1 Tax=Kwoniella bestiolae CBS 10118 TaxID=1296100 RepID=A0AAJ8MCD7_9TREE
MVSARPPPNPAKGRIPYPSAATYVPGDTDNSPTYLGSTEPIQKTASRDSERERRVQGLKNWWKGFRENEQSGGQSSGARRGVFGEPLAESIEYASVQVSTNGPDGSLYVWGYNLQKMPEPIIPFDFYDDFRNVLSSHLSGSLAVDEAIAQYKSLIQALPRIHLYLLLYVLDLLSVFARRADKNLMTAPSESN